jgi:hypothetical protein
MLPQKSLAEEENAKNLRPNCQFRGPRGRLAPQAIVEDLSLWMLQTPLFAVSVFPLQFVPHLQEVGPEARLVVHLRMILHRLRWEET